MKSRVLEKIIIGEYSFAVMETEEGDKYIAYDSLPPANVADKIEKYLYSEGFLDAPPVCKHTSSETAWGKSIVVVYTDGSRESFSEEFGADVLLYDPNQGIAIIRFGGKSLEMKNIKTLQTGNTD